jgi:autotransporter-associated beta strand protein
MKRIKLFVSALILSTSTLFVLVAPHAFAAQIVWEGDVSSDPTVGGNWTGGSAPTSSDQAVFPSDAVNTTVTFPSGVAYASISFTDDGAGTDIYTLDGTGPLTLTGGITNDSGQYVKFEVPIVLGASQTFDLSNEPMLFQGTLNLASYTLTIAHDAVDGAPGGASFDGVISGSGGLTKTGDGRMFLDNANLYTGATIVSGGTLTAVTTTSLGTSAGGTTVASGAKLFLTASIDATFAEPLTLAGNTSTPVLTVSDPSCMADEPYTTITLSGDVTLQSDILVNACTKNGKMTGAITGSHSIGISSDATGTFELASSSNDSATPNGVLKAEATETKYEANSPSTNITVHGNETAIVTGTYGNVFVNTGGILKGTGTVDAVNVSGTIAPGLSPGCLSTGNFVMNDGATYAFELGGKTACTQYDQIKVTGTVQVGGTLNVSLYNGFKPVAGQKYVIISNDGTDALTSSFTDLSEGDTITLGDYKFTISYKGGDGNDVELTVTAGAPDTGFTLLPNSPVVTFAATLGAVGALVFMARRRKFVFATARTSRRKR